MRLQICFNTSEICIVPSVVPQIRKVHPRGKRMPIRTALFFHIFSLFVLVSKAAFAAGSASYANTTEDGSGAVASVSPLATAVGIDIYGKGGNAVDAAIAAAFALGVVDGFNSGIGGGCFVLAHLESGEIIAIDGREMAPKKAHRDMFLRDGKAVPELSREGALAIGVPGSVQALFELQQKAGKLTFSDVIQPSITLAEKGYEINELYAARLARTAKKLNKFPASAEIFLKEGEALLAGDKLIQKDLAKTYRLLAKDGPDYFYRGDFAKKVAKWMKQNEGLVTKKDFENYSTKNREPIKSTFNGYEVLGFPPPSSGGIHVAQILAMVESYVKKYSVEALKSHDDFYHWYIESSKRAFADRAHWLGDADFADVPIGLLDANYLAQRASTISTKSIPVEGHGLPPNYKELLFNRHTTHLAATDKKGNWVAITTTLNTSFGSGVTIPGTGVMMNNQMDDFSAQPGKPNAYGLVGAEANSVRPGKRPLSSMSPTLVLKDGQPVLTAGAAGGPTIISQVAQTLINRLLYELPLQDALAKPRVHHQWRPDRVFIDSFASDDLKQALKDKGHNLKDWPRFGATQAIALEKGELVPVSEPRIQ